MLHKPDLIKQGLAHLLTSDKDISRVRFISRLGGDPQGVETLVLLVQVRERQCGSISTPAHVGPFRRRQKNIWWERTGYYLFNLSIQSAGVMVFKLVYLPSLYHWTSGW